MTEQMMHLAADRIGFRQETPQDCGLARQGKPQIGGEAFAIADLAGALGRSQDDGAVAGGTMKRGTFGHDPAGAAAFVMADQQHR
jgi:hypothetical protein